MSVYVALSPEVVLHSVNFYFFGLLFDIAFFIGFNIQLLIDKNLGVSEGLILATQNSSAKIVSTPSNSTQIYDFWT